MKLRYLHTALAGVLFIIIVIGNIVIVAQSESGVEHDRSHDQSLMP